MAKEEEKGKKVEIVRRLPDLWSKEGERFLDRDWPDFGLGVRPRFGLRHWQRRWLAGDFAWSPDVDVVKKEGKVIVRANLPGVKREDIDVSIQDNMLVIKGSRKEEKEVKEEDYYRVERMSGKFSRAISLPEGVKAEVK